MSDELGTPCREERSELAMLRWRCRRGMLELEMMLTTFLDANYAALDQHDRAAFKRLLDYPDPSLLQLLLGMMSSADPELARVTEKIRDAAAA